MLNCSINEDFFVTCKIGKLGFNTFFAHKEDIVNGQITCIYTVLQTPQRPVIARIWCSTMNDNTYIGVMERDYYIWVEEEVYPLQEQIIVKRILKDY